MASSLHRKKRIRQNVKRRANNQARRSELKTTLRKSQTAVTKPIAADTETTVREAIALIDRLANKGTLHKNNAARKKSRLARQLNAAKAAKK